MEGGAVQARTFRDIGSFDRAVRQLRAYFETLLREDPARRAPTARPPMSIASAGSTAASSCAMSTSCVAAGEGLPTAPANWGRRGIGARRRPIAKLNEPKR